MQRVIGGKRYNTETADVIADWDNGCFNNDFHACAETLFRTKHGNYFVAGRGGALSRWSVAVGTNGRGGSSGIVALTPAEALAWMEEHKQNIPDNCPEIAALVTDA